jgi:hypothetical protein
MDNECKQKFLNSRNLVEINKVLETAGAPNSAKELARIAVSLPSAQETLRTQYMNMALTEAEEAEKKKTVTEVDGGTSHSSTSTEGLPKEGEEVTKDDVRKEPDTKDQMGAVVNETDHMGQGYQQPQPPQMQQMNGGQQQCPPPQMQQMGQMPPPPQQPPNPMQQMQYTLNTIQEAIKNIDGRINKIEETQSQMPQNGSIEVGSRIVPTYGETGSVRETTSFTAQNILDKRLSGINEDHITSKHVLIEKDSNELSRLNDYLDSKKNNYPGVE